MEQLFSFERNESFFSMHFEKKFLYLFLLTACVLVSSSFTRQTTGQLTITVHSIKSNSGKVMLALFNTADAYPMKDDQAVRKVLGTITNYSSTILIRDLPYGTYAAILFHDENNNSEMDYNMVGIPKEGIGASNDAKMSFGPPSFEDAKFQLNTPQKTIQIKMRY